MATHPGVEPHDPISTPGIAARALAAVAASISGFAIALQLVLSLRLAEANGKSVVEGVLIFLSYFTVLSNCIVFVALVVPLLAPRSAPGRFFRRPGVATAIAAYIAMVGIVYSLLLRHVWNPQGWQLLADRLLHDVMPIVFVAYWWFTIPKRGIALRAIPWWLIYPLCYLGWSLARGAVVGTYPYPFIDVGVLGYGRTLINAAGMVVAFAILSAVLVGLARLKTLARP